MDNDNKPLDLFQCTYGCGHPTGKAGNSEIFHNPRRHGLKKYHETHIREFKKPLTGNQCPLTFNRAIIPYHCIVDPIPTFSVKANEDETHMYELKKILIIPRSDRHLRDRIFG